MKINTRRWIISSLLIITTAVVVQLVADASSTAFPLIARSFPQREIGSTLASSAEEVYVGQPGSRVVFVPVPVASKWNEVTAYKTGDVVRGADGNTYRATDDSANVNPINTGTRVKWELLAVVSDVTLLVPSRFPTINAALDFARNARIEGDAMLNVQVADGTYNYGTASIIINHPDGARIHLRGNPSNPASCKIIWNSYVSGIVVSDGHRLGRVEGFELIGQGNKVVPPYAFGKGLYPPSNNGDAIGAYYGATVSVRNCIVRKWLHGITAWGGSHVDVFDTMATDCWDSGFFGYSNSSLYAVNCIANDNTDNDTLGYGFIVEGASSGFLQACAASNNRIAGVYANDGSCLIMRRSTVKGNGDGILLRAASIEGDTNVVTDNRRGGVHFVSGSSGRLFATKSSNNNRNFWSEENSVIEIGGGGNYSTQAAVAGFSCRTGGLITGTSNVPPSNISKNGVDFEKYVPPASQYLP